ncbi:TonB-dependent receptor plug domain-containing protein [Pseudoduganella sp. UC29_106]|uniref:TonB-dependent receptor plug domain-containing protein n=1 Tax=Pseudoduganella sp. UC29_106 TaxID=3374553 RepID=UPI003757FE1A
MYAAGPACAQDSKADGAPAATVVVTGTRVSNRSVLDTASPVDVVSAESLGNVGVTEVSQSLANALPALNFPRPGLTDATDTVRPVTLRGLAPDQVLVLVNSKRRHAAALVNVNGSVGRGSASADLNTIPSAIIGSVEVLRDGAAAQYGSDAIAGVINFRLRENRSGGSMFVNAGERKTDYAFNTGAPPAGLALNIPKTRSRTDGGTVTVGGWKGFSLGEDGFLTVAAEFKKQEHTERSGFDLRQQYPLVNKAFDSRELTINRYDTWYGEPELRQATFFANAGTIMAGGRKVYASASYQRRESESAGFFRRPLQDENILSIYPDGYMPIIAPTVDDYSMAGGTSWSEGGWDYDASIGFGKNKMSFEVKNSLNRSIGPTSKTNFDAGGFSYEQLALNFSAVHPVEMAVFAAPLNVALGAELRKENYTLWAGEPDSYRYGGVKLASGTPAPAGAQVFPGYTPDNAIDSGRHSMGAFVDLETKLTSQLLISLAMRGEHYSDFGNNVTGKLAARYDFSPMLALRGSVQNGFRAPSPQQQFYTSTSMTFIDGAAFNIATFRPSDPVAIALGAKPLDAERSRNYSLGTVLRLGPVSVTADAYRIDITNRIVLSENLTQTNVRQFLESKGYTGVGGGRFFINGVDTRTEGIDIVANVPLKTVSAGRFDFTLAGNYNKTEVLRVPVTAQLAALNPAPTLFGRSNVLGLERGQPKNKFSATVEWKGQQWGSSLNVTRYGEVLSAGSTAATDFVMTPKVIVNLEGRYAVSKEINLAFGADNLFDVYPDMLPASLNSTGAAPYSNRSPFGRAGRFLYARLSYKF